MKTEMDKFSNKVAIPSEFDEYLQAADPDRRQKAAIWKTAVGLQAVDGLQTSEYLLEQARRHVEGEVSIDQVRSALCTYYEQKTDRLDKERTTEEADKVAANISRLLSQKALSFSLVGFLATHRAIFEGVFPFAGQIRRCNITKREWVLRGDTVLYMHYEDILRGLEYDLDRERWFSYKGLSVDALVEHLAEFTSGLWQIHAFREGNTRTVAVFLIQYLRYLGFNVDNDVFSGNSWYFRNALVRCVYSNFEKQVHPELKFLEAFLRNLLLGENNELRNRYLLINPPAEWKEPQELSCESELGKKEGDPQVSSLDLLVQDRDLSVLVLALGEEARTSKDLLAAMALKDMKNFRVKYLRSGLERGVLRLLYPDVPRHRSQKYLLTALGLALFCRLKRSRDKK